MANQLFQQYGKQPVNDGGFAQMVQQIQQFRQSFRGDPRQEAQRLLNSGEMTQDQFNRYAQMADQIAQMMR